jgi:hypothetical protein
MFVIFLSFLLRMLSKETGGSSSSRGPSVKTSLERNRVYDQHDKN